MENQNLIRLFALIKDQRDELLAQWRQRIGQLPAAASLDVPTTNAISAEHGLVRWQAGFDVTEVIAEYNIVRQRLQDAAEHDAITLRGKPLHIMNDVFDDAIGKAVKAFETKVPQYGPAPVASNPCVLRFRTELIFAATT